MLIQGSLFIQAQITMIYPDIKFNPRPFLEQLSIKYNNENQLGDLSK